jgi:glycosyltransferase involved in cell wall biosynthesis
MRATISVGGRYYAFDIAQQLEERGCLGQLITSYPVFETVKYGVPRSKIHSILIKALLERAYHKLPPGLRRLYNPQYFLDELFDRLAARKLEPCDVCTAFSGFGRATLRRARKLGAVSVLERACSHIAYQQRVLQEEYDLWGIQGERAHPRIVEKELEEYAEADFITVPSSFARRSFIEEGVDGDRVISLPLGVDLGAFHPSPRQDRVFRVIYAGRVSIRKGIPYLLRAFTELNLPNSELLLVGSVADDIKPFLVNSHPGVKLAGHRPQRELQTLYSQASVFCIMSIEDGFAVVVSQAMACGLPVICTGNTGACELITEGESGYVLPIRDVEGLKHRLETLYQNPELGASMGKRAEKQVATGHTWDDYGQRIVSHYGQMLARLQSTAV